MLISVQIICFLSLLMMLKLKKLLNQFPDGMNKTLRKTKMIKVTQEIKDLVQKHRNAIQKINELENEIQNLKVAKQSLEMQLENQLWDLNADGEGGSEVYDAAIAIDGVSSVSIIDFCGSKISRVDGIVHHPLAKVIYSDED